ncbi:MAG: hypothetical protein EPN21_05395 [Methylococcaceae bacterium]|nr:MAG: hypothetical protein EPN21_05395 [Methylococcaceae bacterium]
MQITRLFLAIGCGIALAACQTSKHYNELHGPASSLSDYGDQKQSNDSFCSNTLCNEESILQSYAQRAGLSGELPLTLSENWQLVVRAGLNAIDEQCEAYMQAMFWADREMRTARDNINLIGATTGTLMGVFGGPATAIATSAAAFGLATQTITNESKGLLFDIEPSGVRRIVSRNQATYRQGIEDRIQIYNSRPAAVTAIQGYLTICLPAHIASQINEAIDLSKFQVIESTSTIKNPKVEVTQIAAKSNEEIHTYTYQKSEDSALLWSWLSPQGKRDKENWGILNKWLESNKINMSISSFVDASEMANQRKDAINYLKNKGLIN